jgi:hypothetical protein
MLPEGGLPEGSRIALLRKMCAEGEPDSVACGARAIGCVIKTQIL